MGTVTVTWAPSSAMRGRVTRRRPAAERATPTGEPRAQRRPRGYGVSRPRGFSSAYSSASGRPGCWCEARLRARWPLAPRWPVACSSSSSLLGRFGTSLCASPPLPRSRWRAVFRTRCARPRASMRTATVWSPPKSMDKSCNCWPPCVPRTGAQASGFALVTCFGLRTWMIAAIGVRCRTSVRYAALLCGEVSMLPQWILAVAIPVAVLVLVPFIVAGFLRDVDAGTILSSKVINVDLDITDQTADVDDTSTPRPIKVRVLASAIVSVGDSDTMIKTAANRFFAKPEEEQLSTLTDLLTSSGRRAINLLTHDQLFSAKSATHAPRTTLPAVPVAQSTALVDADEEDDPLAIIIRKACSRELTDLGLVFNSLNIKVVQSEVAEARRRQSAAEAQANADIVSALQTRRAKEAQLDAERMISDKQRELEQTKAANAALVAQAEAKRQQAMGVQREAELDATQIAQAKADAEKVRIDIEAKARAEGLRITTIAEATAESIRQVNESIKAGGEAYFRYRQIELLPQIAPVIAEGLADAKLVTISGSGAGAPETTAQNIAAVIQTALAAQLVTRGGLLDGAPTDGRDMGRQGKAAKT